MQTAAVDNIDRAPVADEALGGVPVIDLAGPAHEVQRAVADACAQWGFFQVIGHAVAPSLMASAAEETRLFFAAAKADKRALARSRDNPWGFYDRELTKNARDKKEIFDIGPDVVGRAGDGPFAGVTPWPAWQPTFATSMRNYFLACEALSAQLVELICAGLAAPRALLRSAFEPEHTSFLRLNYYPVEDPLADEGEGGADFGIHHHTDAGALTVLLQDEVSGLQVYRNGAWWTVRPARDAFVINIGDMMQVWSNDLYQAPIHRVLAMDRNERRSLPFFYNPSYETVVEPLAEVLSEGRRAHYRGISWGDFRRRRADGDFANYGAEVQIADYRV